MLVGRVVACCAGAYHVDKRLIGIFRRSGGQSAIPKGVRECRLGLMSAVPVHPIPLDCV